MSRYRFAWWWGMACVLAAIPMLSCSAVKWPLSSPFKDLVLERWCNVTRDGAAVYGEFSADLEAQVFVAPTPAPPQEVAPTASSFGDRGPSVRAWQEHLMVHGFSPGPLDGIHGTQTERATEAWLKNRSEAAKPQPIAAPWAMDYARAKTIVEALREGLLALCQQLDEGEDVTRQDMLAKGLLPASEAFGKVVELHRDVMAAPPAPGQPLAGLGHAAKTYDHELILDKLRTVQGQAQLALAREK